MLHIFLFARLCRSGSLYAEAKYAAMECNVKKAQKRTQFDKVVAKTKISAQLLACIHTHKSLTDQDGFFVRTHEIPRRSERLTEAVAWNQCNQQMCRSCNTKTTEILHTTLVTYQRMWIQPATMKCGEKCT